MRAPFSPLVCLLLLMLQAPLSAQADPGLAIIARLGQLNGLALHCKALGETQKMKRALVRNLPKRRQLGELFDLETHQSFMRFMQEDGTCPTAASLEQKVGEAITELEAIYRDVRPD